jgi:hypothetical protein
MPPQQPDRLLDLIDDGLGFRAHGKSRNDRANGSIDRM